MEIITYLSENNGTVTAVATVILAMITAYYAILTYLIYKSNNKSTKEQVRPYVVFHIYEEDQFMKMSIQNIGKRPAKEVKIRINPEIDNLELCINKNNPLNKQLSEQAFIPPGFAIKTVLQFMPNYFDEKLPSQIYTISINYQNLEDEKFSEDYIINLDNYLNRNLSANFTELHYQKIIGEQLKNIAEHQKSNIELNKNIAENLKKISQKN